MAEQRPLVEQVLDAVVFAPIGALATVTEQVPALVAKGRTTLGRRVTVARMVGRMAVATARRRVDAVLAEDGLAEGGLAEGGLAEGGLAEDGLGREGDSERGSTPGSAAATDPRDAKPSAEDPGAGSPRGSSGAGAPRGSAEVVSVPPPVGGLAIPGYDALAASQVVQRLDGLDAAELEQVRRYELATRGRRTILGRIAQLQTHPDAGS